MVSFIKTIGTNWKAGLAVAMINIPLCLSLSIASGAGPLPGLLTGAWMGIIMSFVGSSKQNIYGAAGSLAGILLPISIIFGPEFLPLIGIISAAIMALLYAFKLTTYIALIPSAALHGFMLGIALLIISTQLTSIVGLHSLPPTTHIIGLIQEIITNIGQVNITAIIVFFGGIIFLRLWKKLLPSFPGAIVLTILGVGIGYLIHIDLIPAIQLLRDSYPSLTFSPLDFSRVTSFTATDRNIHIIGKIIIASTGVAIIAILETLISAKIATKLTKDAFDVQQEVKGLSIATLITSIVGGLPGAGVVVRTGMNIKNKATHRTAGLITGVTTLLLSRFLFSSALAFLPFAIIAAILIDLASGMINIALYKKIRTYQRSGLLIVILVGLIAVFHDPLVAIGVGSAIALIVYLQTIMASNNYITVRSNKQASNYTLDTLDPSMIPENSIVRIREAGALNYLTNETIAQFLMQLGHVDAVIFSMASTAQIDMDGIEMLEDILTHLDKVQTPVYFTGLREPIKNVMLHSSILAMHLEDHEYESTSEVIELLSREKNM